MASVDVSLTSPEESSNDSQASFTYIEQNYHETTQNRILGFRRSEDYTDVVVKSRHVKISCHRLILASGSNYLHTLLKSDMSSDNVELNEVSPEILGDIIDFFYTAKIQVTSDNVKAICLACPVLQLDNLLRACDKFMAENIAPFNCFSMFKFSKANDLEMTMKAAQECMLTKPKDILRLSLETEYQSLSEDELISYISNDDLQVDDEAIVFEIVLKWIESDRANREKAFENVLQYVRLPFCTPEFLCNVKEACPYCKSEKCEALIWEAMKYHVMPASRNTMGSVRAKPRKCFKGETSTKNFGVQVSPKPVSQAEVGIQVAKNVQLVVMGGKSGYSNANKYCWLLNEDSNAWEEFTELPTDFTSGFQACYSENNIIVTGGEKSNGSVTSYCWTVNIHNQKWKPLPSLLTPRTDHAMVLLGEDIYVCGGKSGYYQTSLSACEKLDKKKKNWTNIASLLTPSDCLAGVSYKGAVYVFGGSKSPKLTQCYCTSTNTWKKKADVPAICQYSPSAVVLNDRIYVATGAYHVCLSYDPGYDIWGSLSQSLEIHYYSRSVLWQGKILVGGTSQEIEECCPKTGRWTKWKIKLPKDLSGYSMLVTPEIHICCK